MAIHPLKYVSLCTGAGGLDAGVHLALGNAQPLVYVERDVEAAQILASRLEDGSLPPAAIWSDLANFDATPLRGMVDLLIGGLPCFAEGTMVLTECGYLPIERITVGDRVLTHKGRWRQVTSTMSRSGANLREIRGQGVPGIVTTDEHPFWSVHRSERSTRKNGKPVRVVSVSEPDWKPAKDIGTGDFIAQVLPDVQPDDKSPEFWWIVGRYLADGWLQHRHNRPNRGRTTICCNPKETEILRQRITAAGFHATEERDRTTQRFHIASTWLYLFLQQFGKLAHGKRVPGFVFELDQSRARALCEGYVSGDGYRGKQKRGEYYFWRVTTVSKALALGIALLAQRAYGVIASIRYYDGKRYKNIEGRTVRQRRMWLVTIPDSNRSGYTDGSYGWKRVRQNTEVGIGTVFNISVEEDESYVADGAVVHNCQPYSVAGKQKGESDDRYIWPHFFRILDACRASMVFLENVPPFVSGGYFRAIGEELCRMGYQIESPLFLGASDVGASHIRKRVFLFAWRKDMEHSTWHGGSRQVGETRPGRGICKTGYEPAHSLRTGSSSQQDRGQNVKARSDDSTFASGGELADTRYAQWGKDAQRGRIAQQGSNRQGQAPSGAGECSQPLENTSSGPSSERWEPVTGEAAGRGTHPGFAGLGRTLAHSGSPRLEERGGESGDFPRECAAFERSSLPLFAPGPNDPRWPDILRDYPELAPATDKETAQRSFRDLAYGSTPRLGFSRTDQLRSLGNLVCPLQGALTLAVLLTRAGFADWIDPMIRGMGEMDTFLEEEVA